MKLAAVVVNWNGGELNLACLSSLAEQTLEPEQVHFVDNGSSDGSLERVQAEFPRVRVHANDSNLGFGHGANRGIRAALDAGAEAVFLVNNDVTLPSGTLGRLAARLEQRAELGIVGPRVLLAGDRGRIWAAGGLATFRQNLSTLRGHCQPDGPEYERRLDVDYVPGCAMLVRRAVFDAIGLLDGDYFAYHEDLDFCLAAGLAGFRVECDGAERAFHDAHASTGGGYSPRRKYMMAVNTVRFLRRHGNARRWGGFWLFDVATLPLLLLVGVAKGRVRGVLAKGLGTWHGLLGREVTAAAIEPGANRLW